jgi:hypothetical protein
MFAGTAGAAHASEPGKPAADKAAQSSVALLPPSASSTYPTWLWGSTEVCVTNWGYSPGRLRVQSQVIWGAPAEYIDVPDPYQKRCIQRWWGAANVDLTNVSGSPLLVEVR